MITASIATYFFSWLVLSLISVGHRRSKENRKDKEVL